MSRCGKDLFESMFVLTPVVEYRDLGEKISENLALRDVPFSICEQ